MSTPPPQPASCPEPSRDALAKGLVGALVDFGVGERAERMVDDHRGEIRHAEGLALHQRFVQKFAGNNDRGRAAQGFETDGVMRTARRARSSIADRRQYDVVVGRYGCEQCRVGVF